MGVRSYWWHSGITSHHLAQASIPVRNRWFRIFAVAALQQYVQANIMKTTSKFEVKMKMWRNCRCWSMFGSMKNSENLLAEMCFWRAWMIYLVFAPIAVDVFVWWSILLTRPLRSQRPWVCIHSCRRVLLPYLGHCSRLGGVGEDGFQQPQGEAIWSNEGSSLSKENKLDYKESRLAFQCLFTKISKEVLNFWTL